MLDPKVEIWEGASLAKAPSVDAQLAGFVRAAVLRWRDEAPARVVLPGDRATLRVAELWTSGEGVAVAGAAGALTVSTALADGTSVVTTNVAGADPTVPPGPDALVEVVEGDVVAAHAARVAALCAERETSVSPPASWRDAPLVLELGDRTVRAWSRALSAPQLVRALALLLFGVTVVLPLLSQLSLAYALRTRPPLRALVEPLALPLAVVVGAEAVAWYARRRVRALVPGREDGASSGTAALMGSSYRFWLLPEPDPQIEALSVASDATRATLASLGFVRRGALRKQADFGRRHSALLQPSFDRLREGRSVVEAWMEDSGLALAWADAIGDEAEIDFLTLLDDATLVTTYCLGDKASHELAANLRTVASAGVYCEVWKGVPGPDNWEAHKRLVEAVCATTGAAVVPVRTLDDALFLKRLSARKARTAGAHVAAEGLNPLRSWKMALVLGGAMMLLNLRSAGVAAGIGFGLLSMIGIWGSMWVGAWAARATGPKLRTLAELRALPVAREPGGAVGNWLE